MNWQEDKKIVDEIVELECFNMLPLLRGMGFNVGPADIITVYAKNQLVGLVRYGNTDGDTIFVKSIQIRGPGRDKMVLRRLLKKAAAAHASERAVKIVSVVQRGKACSIHLHERFGFSVEKEHLKAIRYSIAVSDLQLHLQKFLGGQGRLKTRP